MFHVKHLTSFSIFIVKLMKYDSNKKLSKNIMFFICIFYNLVYNIINKLTKGCFYEEKK